MLSRRVVLAAALFAGAAGVAHAAPSSDRARRSHDQPHELLPGAALAKPLRAYTDVSYGQVPAARRAAWQQFAAALPGLAVASWDTATGVPSRIWGRGLDVPGSVADPALAEAAALRLLGQHLALLAPGAQLADFTVAANVRHGAMRTIGLVQHHRGVEVVGGQVSFRFKHDRLFVIGSEALPAVTVAWPTQRAAVADVRVAAAAATVVDLGLDPARVTTRASAAPVILPLVGDRGVLGYRLAVAVEVDAGSGGAWRVWADAATGAPLVRRSTTPSAGGTIALDAVERWTGRPRRTYPAPRLAVTVDGRATQTDGLGRVTWTGTAPVSVGFGATGALVEVENLGGSAATASLTLAPDGTAVWQPGEDRNLDAQISGYLHANLVKEYVRGFAPELEFLDEVLPVKVNIADECNAFSNGNAIHFFQESDRCVNTATIADVVYHEFGHSVHFHSIIRGVGFFDGAFSEGLSDYLAATITDDPAMARGFFKSDEPLRQLDPLGREAIWPRDIDEIHTTGIIFGGAMWDLRKALILELGREPGIALADHLFYAAVQRASSIPATLVEILAEDDDDGDLLNGTPHECTIRAAFGRHGLRTTAGHIDAPGSVESARTEPVPLTLRLDGLDTRCGDTVSTVKLEWRPRGGGPTAGSVAATDDDLDAQWSAALPLPMDGFALFFRFRVGFADGSEMVFPDNRADPWYQFYHGDVVPLYCTNFETNPFAEGWRAGGTAEVWQWGVPGGSRGVGDPATASSGTRILGTGLSFLDGTYAADTVSWVESPVIDVDNYSDVRLQYRRWLSVEDGFYDQATIEINGEQAWANLSSQGNQNHTTHHEDKAWLFQDIPISSRIFDGTVSVRWLIDSDDGFELGGWNLDDVCIVANPRSVCGDGRMSGAEQCDDGAGNANAADACRSNCRIPNCGDAIKDTIEACDDGNEDDSDGCTALCEIVETEPTPEVDGGCATGGTGAGLGGAGGLGLALALLVTRRRRR